MKTGPVVKADSPEGEMGLRLLAPPALSIAGCCPLELDWLLMAKISLLVELWHFIRYRKKWWLAPILFILVLLGIIIVFAETSALAPFLYPLF